MDLKQPLSFEDQVNKLIAHGLEITDRERAKEILSQINYYRFTGYALQFRKNPMISDYFPGVAFEQVYKIYLFDEELRDICRKYIEIIEVYYRTQISYGFSMTKCVSPPYDQHYDASNFYRKKGYADIVESFQKEKNYYRDSLVVKHHKKKYSNKMPLWVMVELMSFSNVSKLYNSMYNSEKDVIAKEVGTTSNMLENHLHCLSVLRNKCAHAARLYNTTYSPPAKLSSNFLKKHPEVSNRSLFAYIVVLQKRLPDMQDRKRLLDDINSIIQKYKQDIELSMIGFPENYYLILEKYI